MRYLTLAELATHEGSRHVLSAKRPGLPLRSSVFEANREVVIFQGALHWNGRRYVVMPGTALAYSYVGLGIVVAATEHALEYMSSHVSLTGRSASGAMNNHVSLADHFAIDLRTCRDLLRPHTLPILGAAAEL